MQRSAQKYPKTCGDLWANISSGTKIYGPISADARRSVGKYQQTCEDLLWANIRKRSKIFRQISADVRSSAVGKYQKMCHKNNISRHAKICSGQISDVLRRLFCKYQQICEDLWANISRHAKICSGQISEVLRRLFCKYQQICEDLGQISEVGQISENVRRSVGTYQQMCEDLWANCSRRAKICG